MTADATAPAVNANTIQRYEAECSRLFLELSAQMHIVSKRMRHLLAHEEATEAHAVQLQGAADCVRQWGEKLDR